MTKKKRSQPPGMLQRFTELAAPCHVELFDRKWRGRDCYAPPVDPELTTATLSAEFSPEELLNVGLFETDDNGQPQLALDLLPTSGPMIALRTTQSSPPWALLTSSGRLIGSTKLPLEALVRKDARTRQLLRSGQGILFATSSVADAVHLRLLGFAAGPLNLLQGLGERRLAALATALAACGLPGKKGRAKQPRKKKEKEMANDIDVNNYRMGPEDNAEEVMARLRGNHELADRAAAKRSNQGHVKEFDATLIVPLWSPVRMPTELAAEVRQKAVILAQTEHVLGIELGHAAVWQPTPEAQLDMAFALRRGTPTTVRRAIRTSVEASTYAVAAYLNPDFQPHAAPRTHAEALTKIQTLLDREARFGIPLDPGIVEDYLQRVDRELYQPLHAAALQASDATNQTLLSQIAETSYLLHAQAPHVRRQLAQSLASQGGEDGRELQQVMKLRDQNLNQLLRLVKTMRR